MTLPVDPTVTPTSPPIPAPAAATVDPTTPSVDALAAAINAPPLAFDALTLSKGTITANANTASPPTVSLTLSGDPTVIPNVLYVDSYSPVVGDTVLVGKQGAAAFVLGQLNDSGTGSANGWTAIPTLGSGFTDPGATAFYRVILEHGDLRMQWKGAVNISGSPTAVCTMPVGARPATNRQVVAATNSVPCILDFNSSGTVVLVASSGTTGSVGDFGQTSADTQSTVSHSHGGAVSNTTITHDDGFHAHVLNSHSHTFGSAPTFFSLEGIEYNL